jgi:hypothetical protein
MQKLVVLILGYFIPDQNPGLQIPGSSNQPSVPGGPIPFYPVNPGQIPSGSPKGTLKQPGQPDKKGTLQPPSGPGQPHLLVPEPPC